MTITMRRPADLLGTCQNATWDDNGSRIENFRYCGAPAMSIPGVRNMCPGCGSRGPGRVLARMVEAFDAESAARWLAGSYARYVDQSLWAYEAAARGWSLEKVREQQRWADQTGEIITAMQERWADEIRHAIRMQEIRADEIGLLAEDMEPIGPTI